MFKKVEPDDIETKDLNVEYGKSSKIILSGIIIDWVAMLFFSLSKYHRYAEKEDFLTFFKEITFSQSQPIKGSEQKIIF